MINSFFEIPEEVIWELSFDDGHNEYPEGSYEEPLKTPKKKAKFIACRNCGFPNLEQVNTPNGPQLVYALSSLRGKLHACDI